MKFGQMDKKSVWVYRSGLGEDLSMSKVCRLLDNDLMNSLIGKFKIVPLSKITFTTFSPLKNIYFYLRFLSTLPRTHKLIKDQQKSSWCLLPRRWDNIYLCSGFSFKSDREENMFLLLQIATVFRQPKRSKNCMLNIFLLSHMKKQ